MKEIKFINCTPHPINVVDNNNVVILSLPKGETIPRLSQVTQPIRRLNGIPITQTIFGVTVDIPEPVQNTYLIVSRLVLEANKDERTDLLVPNDIVRNEQGHIIGCRSFAIN